MQIEKIESEFHKNLMDLNMKGYTDSATEMRRLEEAIELCKERGDDASNLVMLHSKLMWRMKRINVEHDNILQSYNRWLREENRKKIILSMKTTDKHKRAMCKLKMHYMEALKCITDNPVEETTDDEMMGLDEPEYYDQDTPPDWDGWYDEEAPPLGSEVPKLAHEAPPLACEMPPSFAPPIQ